MNDTASESSHRWRRPALLWLAVAAWAGLIFYLSAQPSLSTNLGEWDYLVRKLAHITEYAILCLLLWRALRQHIEADRTAVILAVAISLSYAISDEYHQTFVAGRAGTALDVGFDLVGIMLVALIAVTRPGMNRRGARTRR